VCLTEEDLGVFSSVSWYLHALAGEEGGKRGKEGSGELNKGPQNGQLILRMGPARMEVRNCVQRATIPSDRVVLY
jgi:hypothetical protein